MLMRRKELSRSVTPQAFCKSTLRPIEFHERQLIACAGSCVLTLLQILGRYRSASELRSRTCQHHASRSGLTEFACKETVLIYWSHKTALCKRSSSTGRKVLKGHYKIHISSR